MKTLLALFAWVFRSAAVIAFLGLVFGGNSSLAIEGAIGFFLGAYVVEFVMLAVRPLQAACERALIAGSRGKVIFLGTMSTILAGILESTLVCISFYYCLRTANGLEWFALLLAWGVSIGTIVSCMDRSSSYRFSGLDVFSLVSLGGVLMVLLGFRAIPPWIGFIGFGLGRVAVNTSLWSLAMRENWREHYGYTANSPISASAKPSLVDFIARAQAGDLDAQFILGKSYVNGERGLPKSLDEGIKWYTLAAVQGDSSSQFNLGNCYRKNEDWAKAYSNYSKAATQGHIDAQHALANCYAGGFGVNQNHAEAAKWYLKAAEAGNTSSQYEIAECFRKGEGVGQNWANAIHWYEKSALQGEPDSQYFLGCAYSQGQGVQKNLVDACAWLSFAAKSGHVMAKQELNRVAPCLGEAQLAMWKVRTAEFMIQMKKNQPVEL